MSKSKIIKEELIHTIYFNSDKKMLQILNITETLDMRTNSLDIKHLFYLHFFFFIIYFTFLF